MVRGEGVGGARGHPEGGEGGLLQVLLQAGLGEHQVGEAGGGGGQVVGQQEAETLAGGAGQGALAA